ncbi:hypothetical protein GCM10009555_028730 [Acrocarpospora macrocephala]|uniref:Uncharacterized protein n=1 Tax=Acrocarpospora macrocephala TaxID=150177 RepID=A0A5M3WT05_9ACTN|nr:hypothetical protein Amac_048160 [Acrocarpospora macrocephala]
MPSRGLQGCSNALVVRFAEVAGILPPTHPYLLPGLRPAPPTLRGLRPELHSLLDRWFSNPPSPFFPSGPAHPDIPVVARMKRQHPGGAVTGG